MFPSTDYCQCSCKGSQAEEDQPCRWSSRATACPLQPSNVSWPRSRQLAKLVPNTFRRRICLSWAETESCASMWAQA